MNKRELVDAVASDKDLTKTEVEGVLDAVLENIVSALEGGNDVSIAGFGSFEVRERAARQGRNPQTGEQIDIAASKAPAFKSATAFKRRINA
jgi:DNA-binding protein HU-beta